MKRGRKPQKASGFTKKMQINERKDAAILHHAKVQSMAAGRSAVAAKENSRMRLRISRKGFWLAAISVVVAAASTGCLKTVPVVGLPDIRVENRSAMDFKNVMVNGKSFGNVKRGERTNYQTIEGAYRYGHVSVSTQTGPLEIFPIDYVGENPLGAGKFTYVLTINSGRLIIDCVAN